MPLIRVLHPGFQTTIQDLGRFGFAHLGISASGAADALSLRVGNLLVGNKEAESALEMTLLGAELDFEERCVIAITGSDFGPKLNGQALPSWQSLEVPAGGHLQLGPTRNGSRCYLCIAGGFDIPLTLGSRSTHLLTGLGGLDGRSLKRGDVLRTRSSASKSFQPRSLDTYFLMGFNSKEKQIHVTEGLQSGYFSDKVTEMFYSSPYTVSEDSNRMGLRLLGPRIEHSHEVEIVTEGAPVGAVQIPQNGEPIILFVEHQTTGGYPKIANVITADLHLVGQLRPRDLVRFQKVSFAEALPRYHEQERFVQSVRNLAL
ncbi:MAG: biotin-dependent carboxyltransferase [Ignavibacteriales bacterium]|nr:biotin-dependent carboxyltransferase [Ignavibacteriales bacterium]